MKFFFAAASMLLLSLALNAAPLPNQKPGQNPDKKPISEADRQAVAEAARNYIVSQHISSKELMAKALHPELAKRTYWRKNGQQEFIMQTSRETMLNVAENYNRKGDKFPANPRVDIKILDIDQRVASVKLSADDWIDYMHLVKNQQGQWLILNVLWQYHDINKHH